MSETTDKPFDERIFLMCDKAIETALEKVEEVEQTDKDRKESYAHWKMENPDLLEWPWVNLRLDWEISRTANDEAAEEGVFPLDLAKPLLSLAMSTDLADLAENGDSSDASDPLLKMADGSKKLGKTLDSVDIAAMKIFAQWKPVKDATEYTVYLAAKFNWQ